METPNHIKQLLPNNIDKKPDHIHLNLNEWGFDHQDSKNDCLSQYGYNSVTHEKLLYKLSLYTNLLPSNIHLTNGGDNAIRLVIDTYCTSKSNVIITVPTYDYYKRYCQIKDLRTHEISIGIEKNINCNIFHTYEQILLQSSHNNRTIVFICHPNNPTGAMISKNDLVELLGTYPNSLFVIDESYIDFYGSDKSMVMLTDKYNNLVVIRTFSKAFGLAGLRIAYLVSHQLNIKNFNLVFNNKDVSELSKEIAIDVLDNYDYYQSVKQQMLSIKEKLLNKLRSLNIKHLDCGCSNFVTLLLHPKHNFLEYCAKYKILVRDLSHRNNLENCVRISIGNEKDMDEIIKLLDEYSLQKKSTDFIIQDYLTDKSKIALLKSLMKQCHDILSENKINYWVECGTLLGVLRHNGIIPWDNDLDIGVMYEEIEKIKSLENVFLQYGIKLKPSRLKNYWVLENIKTGVYIDVFPFVKIGNEIVNIDERFRKPDDTKNVNIYYTSEDEIFPLKTYKFYNFEVNVPNKAETVMERSVPNFMNSCVINGTKFNIRHFGFA